MEGSATRDIIVIGASLGGIEALTRLAGGLPGDLPAAVLVVQHVSPHSPGVLPGILDQRGPLSAVTAEDGMPLERGRIHVAPPDRHLLLVEGGVRVSFGPRENRSRPAIDPLFRSAAVSHRSRVIGVVLTGLLGDGAAGLRAVHRCGGVAVVQDPGDAAHPEMPLRALASVPDALRATLPELPALLDRLAREHAPLPPEVPETIALEARLTERAMKENDWGDVPTRATDFTCPECNGALRRVADGSEGRYRCRVGHAYSGEDLLAAKEESLEDTLWVALQTLQERAQMLDTLADEDEGRGWSRSSGGYRDRAREAHRHAARLRELIANLAP